MILRILHCGVAAILAAGLAGCSVHPLPQDVAPRVSTVDIVRRIRCEARDGLLAARKAALQRPDGEARVEKIVEGTTIGFEFKFVMAETDRAAGGQLVFQRKDLDDVGFKLTLLGDLNTGQDDGTKGSSRKNTRVFRVVDDLKDLDDAECRHAKARGPNLAYPITGSMGMAEAVRTYIELEMLTDLRGAMGTTDVLDKLGKPVLDKDGKPKKKPVEVVAFSDDLDFETLFEAGLFPDLELGTAVGTFKLVKASVAGIALRKDSHSVTVVLARDHKHVDVDLAPRTVAMTASGFPIKDIRDKRLQTFLLQRNAVARNRVLLEMDRRRLVAEDKTVVARVLTGNPP